MSVSRRTPRLLIPLATLLLVIALALAVAWQPLLRPALYARLGEKQSKELFKGALAYLYLQVTQPIPDLAPYTPMRYTSEPPFGVNAFLEQEVEPAKVARSLDAIKAAGFHFVRQEFPWEDIEISGKGDFWDHKWNVSAWEKYDRIVDMANERGLQLIVRLDHPPAWTRAAGISKGYFAPPDRLEDYGDFVEAVVRRYRGKVRYYQIWNEPNIRPEWGEQPADPAGYTRLLQMAYRRAKAADPSCVILSAGLAQTVEMGPLDLSDLVYLQRMYDAGARGYFDIMGVMAYGLWTGPTDHRVSPDRTNFARPQLIRAIMVRNGDADKPIWATEIGWNAVPKGSGLKEGFGRVTREEQALYAAEAYQRAQQEWPWMGVMNYWFLKRATDSEKNRTFYYFNLLEPDFAPWPAYAAIRAYATRPPVVYPGYQQEDHWALQYSGDWQSRDDPNSVLGSYRLGSPGARLRFTFWGSELDLVTFGQANLATVQATVDGRPVRISRSQVQGWPALALVRQPRPALHTVEIQVAAGAGGLALDGLVVRRVDRLGWDALGALGALGIGAGWLASLLRASRRRFLDRGLRR